MQVLSALRVFPAHAGMNPPPASNFRRRIGIPRACGDEPKEVIIMESNSKITALLGLLMALPITLFWTGVSGIGITLVCLVIFRSEYFLQATLLFTTLFFIVLNVNGWRELRR